MFLIDAINEYDSEPYPISEFGRTPDDADLDVASLFDARRSAAHETIAAIIALGDAETFRAELQASAYGLGLSLNSQQPASSYFKAVQYIHILTIYL